VRRGSVTLAAAALGVVGLVVWAAVFHNVEVSPPGRVRLRWSGVTGEVHHIQRTFDLGHPFSTIAAHVPAEPPENEFVDDAGDPPRVFYRTVADPEALSWMQHAHDAQRTGYAPRAPPHPWRWAWQWNGSDATGGVAAGKIALPRNVQPILGGGRVYVARGATGITALDEVTGAPLWTASPGGAINSSPAYDPERPALFVVSANGRLYRLNPTNGATTGSVLIGQGSSLPLPPARIRNRVWVSMGRNVAAVNPDTLEIVWSYNAGAAVHTPPAYSGSRDCVVVCTEDLFVHAIRNRNGTRLWRVKPSVHQPDEDHSYANGWPAIAERYGLVLVRQRIHWDYLWNDAFGVPNNAAIRAALNASPELRCHFALRLDDGAVAFDINNGLGGFGDGGYMPIGSMPVIRTFPDGSQVALNAVRGDPRYDARWDSHFGEIMLSADTVPGLQPGDVRWTRHGNGPSDDDFLLTDEQPFISAAGDYLFGNHWLVTYALRVTDRGPARGSFANKIETANLSWFIVSQGACGPCVFSPTHYCAAGLYEDPSCSRRYAGGFYVCYNQGEIHDAYWTEYGCVVATPERLIVRDTTGAIFCLVSGNPNNTPPAGMGGGSAGQGDVAFVMPTAAPASASGPTATISTADRETDVEAVREGALAYVFNNGKAILLSFEFPHQGHFKALIREPFWPLFDGLGVELGRNRATPYTEGTRVRVRGVLKRYQGDPAIYVESPAQIEILPRST